MTEYRCHNQPVYTAEVLTEAHFDKLEQLLRAAERSVNERAEICRQMADRAHATGATGEEQRWRAANAQAAERAKELRVFFERDWIRPQSKIS